MEMNGFVSASIKEKQYRRLVKLSKKEKHTISDQLNIVLEYYSKIVKRGHF